MAWHVDFADEFDREVEQLSKLVRRELLASADLLSTFGPQLGRPHVDTLKGSAFSNMKELRFRADSGVWRVAFAFNPERKAILLVAGDKTGTSEARFYKALIDRADERYRKHLDRILGSKKETR